MTAPRTVTVQKIGGPGSANDRVAIAFGAHGFQRRQQERFANTLSARIGRDACRSKKAFYGRIVAGESQQPVLPDGGWSDPGVEPTREQVIAYDAKVQAALQGLLDGLAEETAHTHGAPLERLLAAAG